MRNVVVKWMETEWVTLFNGLWWERDEGSVSILVLVDLSVAFDTINNGILLEQL